MGILTHKAINIVEPALQFTDDVTLTTDESYTYHSYIVPRSKLRTADSSNTGSFLVEMPTTSNIRDMERFITKECHQIPNCNIYKSNNVKKGISQKIWTDSIGRIFASKIERSHQGVSFRVRGDVAMTFMNHGLAMIQCNQLICHVFHPNQFSVNLTRFGFEKPSKKQISDESFIPSTTENL